MPNIFDTEAFAGLSEIAKRSVSSSVITGSNPTWFDSSNPVTLFIIQLFIIISFTSGLGWVFSFIKQPKVIAEVIGGILLGPTVLGRIPHFTYRIFPTQSISYLNLIANIGLILFLFLIGLEVDVGIMKKNGKNSAVISIAGMVLPFGLGVAVAVPIYNNYVDSSKTTFGHFLLFVGVAMSITAFPVLCRILTSTKLLDDRVGVIVLAAGVGNDVVGWVLLALTLALVNAKAGVTAVYVLLCAVGWTLLVLFPIRWGFIWLARRSGSLTNGPTPGMMIITLLIVFASSFVTSIIGVHAIFGAFVAGLIIPHEGGFAVALVEKIEDLITMLFIPIYFVLSGLQTNLGLLDRGKDWGYLILLCVIGWVGKFVGCGGAAKLLGFSNRESGAIGMLMSCKGLVELIVLNVGLSAGIIDQRLFSIFVVVALVLTFITTPFTLLIYPEHVRGRNVSIPRKHKGRDTEATGESGARFALGSGGREETSKFLVVLQKIEHLAAVMLLTQMLEPTTKSRPASSDGKLTGKSVPSLDGGDLSIHSSPSHAPVALPDLNTGAGGQHTPGGASSSSIHIDALKLTELTGRTFSVMQSAEKDQLLLTDDTLQLYRQFGRLKGVEITPHLSVVETDSFSAAVADHAEGLGSEMVILPWTVPVVSSSSALIDPSTSLSEKEGIPQSSTTMLSPFESIFGSETTGSPMYTHFLRRAFSECPSDIALFVDRGFGSAAAFTPGSEQHIFLPFFGGPDDRLALRFVVQLCHHHKVSATVVRISRADNEVTPVESQSTEGGPAKVELSESMQIHNAALQSNQLTVGPQHSAYAETTNRLASETADDIAWSYYTALSTTPRRSAVLENALARIHFDTQRSSLPLSQAYDAAEQSANNTALRGFRQWRPMMIVIGRGRRGSTLNHGNEATKFLTERSLSPSVGAELRKTVGDVATALMLGGGAPSSASYLVLQAGNK